MVTQVESVVMTLAFAQLLLPGWANKWFEIIVIETNKHSSGFFILNSGFGFAKYASMFKCIRVVALYFN